MLLLASLSSRCSSLSSAWQRRPPPWPMQKSVMARARGDTGRRERSSRRHANPLRTPRHSGHSPLCEDAVECINKNISMKVKVNFTFTNKTDSGLTISMFQTIRSNGTEAVGTAESDGNSFSFDFDAYEPV